MATSPEPQRKSPEYRSVPMSKLVLDPPIRVPTTFAEHFSRRQPSAGSGKLDERRTPPAQEMVDGVPGDGHWYLAAICYSQGEATALSSHIARGAYGKAEVATGQVPNKNKRGMQREHVVLLKKDGR